MKRTFFWNVTPCSLVEFDLWFGGLYSLHLQGWYVSRGGKQDATRLQGFLFIPKDRGSSTLTWVIFYQTIRRYVPDDSTFRNRYARSDALSYWRLQDRTERYPYVLMNRKPELSALRSPLLYSNASRMSKEFCELRSGVFIEACHCQVSSVCTYFVYSNQCIYNILSFKTEHSAVHNFVAIVEEQLQNYLHGNNMNGNHITPKYICFGFVHPHEKRSYSWVK
jgi:hypothetical protein